MYYNHFILVFMVLGFAATLQVTDSFEDQGKYLYSLIINITADKSI